jgi:hypothetical protein
LQERVDQHENDVSNRHQNIPKTALVEHVLHHESLNNGNPKYFSFDFEGTKILAQESNNQRRKLVEAPQTRKIVKKFEKNNKVYRFLTMAKRNQPN